MYKMLTKPYDHQQRVFDESKDAEYYAWFWEMGLGKSKIALDNIGHLYTEGEITGALIIAPKGVYMNWYNEEIEKHLGLEDYFWGAYRSSARKAEKQEMADMLKARESLTICCMNTEAFSHKSGCQYAEKFLRTHKCIMIIDESTAIKSTKATRTKMLIKLGTLAKYRRVMSGTPITQSPLDMFGQCEFLKRMCLGFKSWTAFKSYFAVITDVRMGTRSFQHITGYRNVDELEDLIRPFASRIKKEYCLDLPEKIYLTRHIEMTPEQAAAYKQMKELAVLEFEQCLVTTTSALTTIVKLQQILCGHVKDDDGNVIDIPNKRVDEVLALAEDNPESKIIVFCCFQRDVELVCEALNKKYGPQAAVDYYGKTDSWQREENKALFCKTKVSETNQARFIVMSSAGAKGLTLIESDLTIYYSNSYNLETRLQSEDRNHRIGQKILLYMLT